MVRAPAAQVQRTFWAITLSICAIFLASCGSGSGSPDSLEVGLGKEALAVNSQLYLHGTGATANPAVLFLDKTAPTGTVEKYKDSPSVNFAGGNPWKDVGTWNAAPSMASGALIHLDELHVWLGLKNSDDQGTKFDLRAEILRNGQLVASGETLLINGVTRNPSLAKEVVVSLSAPSGNFNGSTDQLSLHILTRIGTNGSGGFGGGHSNATGLRLYFDSTARPSRFGTTQNTGPQAVANATPTSGTAPLEVSFDATGSIDPDGVIVKWEWDLLGDGGFQDYTLTAGVASFTYVNGGTYHPALRVTDDSGATDTASATIEVNAAPVAVGSGSPDYGYPPMLVQFDGSGSHDPDGSIVNYEWDFGEGAGYQDFDGSPTASHTYNSAGNYTAMLRVTDNDGATATAAVSINTTQEPPNQAPVAEGNVTPLSGTQPLNVSFDGSASHDPDGSVVMWEWDLGDGSGFQDYSLTHGVLQFTYITSGDKTATLRVTDDDSATDTKSFSIHVNAHPDAIGDAVPSSGNAPLDAVFNASGSSDADGSIVQWEWDFGEGSGFEDFSGTQGGATHVYSSPGSYVAVLRVTDNEGGQDLFNLPIFVNHPPTAALLADPLSGSVPLDVDFDAAGSTDPDNDILLYEWDFDGNGTFDAEAPADQTPAQASFTYVAAGTYNAGVRVTDSFGAQATASVVITAAAPPVADWTHTLGFNSADFALGSAIDASGNVYVAGTTTSSGQSGAFGSNDVLIAKYSNSGVLQPGWPMRWGGSGDDSAYDIAVDPNGNILVAGLTNGFPYGDTGGYDLFCIKLNPAGTLLWDRTVGTPGTEFTSQQCIALDGAGDVYLGCTTTYSGTYASISKLNGSNGQLIWHKLIGGQTGHNFGAIAVDPDGVYALGIRADGGSFPWNNLYLIKMSQTNGNGMWQRQLQIAGDHFTEARGLALTYHGGVERVYGTASITTGRYDAYVFTVTGDGDGVVTGRRWADSYNKHMGGVAVDSSGNVIVSANSGGSANLALLKFDSNLNTLETERWAGTSTNDAGEVLINPADDRIFVAGTAANNTGSWESFSPLIVDQGASYINNTAIINSFMNFEFAHGTLHFAPGYVEDTGGGSSDMFIARREMGNFPPNDPPVAQLSANPASGAAPLPVDFDASGSYDPDGSIVKYEWDFDGNGSYDLDSGNDATVTHSYPSAGSYSATVRVTDNRNATGAATTSITVTAPDWTHSWGSSQNEILHDLAMSGTALVSAGESNSASVGGVVLKHDTAGGFQWGRRYNATGSNYQFMGVDINSSSGDIYAVGSFSPGPTGLVTQYSSSGSLGWQRGLQGPLGSVVLNNVAAAPGGDVYCVGRAFLSGNYHQYVAKFDSGGTLQWQKTFGSANSDEAHSVALDSSGNVYVVGTVNSFTAAISCFDPSGNLLWARSVGPGGASTLRDVRIGADGSIYLVGYGNSAPGQFATLLAKLAADGTFIKAIWWNGIANFDEQHHLALAPDQSGYVTSHFGATAPPPMTDVLRFDAALNVTGENRWTPALSKAIGCGIACDGQALYFGANSANSSGSWSVVSGSYTNGTGIGSTAFMPTIHSTSGAVTVLSGSSAVLSGVVDSGGGSSDFLLSRRTMP